LISNNTEEVVMRKSQNCTTQLAASLRELADMGSAVDLSAADTKDEPADIEINQVGGVYDPRIFGLPNGSTGYMFYLVVTNQTSRTIYSRDVKLRMFWQDSLFQWMRDPLETRSSEVYRFPGSGSPELPRDLVLNHVLLEGGALTPRLPLEGWLLATGGRMPEKLRDRQGLDMTLAILASNGVEYTETIRLWAERLAAKPKFATRGKANLFEEPLGHHRLSGRLQPARRFHDLEIGKPAPGPRRTSQFTT
jgi:hypothetical protein